MIDKKTIKKSLIIISLIIIIIVAIIQIGKTLARYESAATTTRDVDVAFWVVDNSFQTQRILINDIYPSDDAFEYEFTVSNVNASGKSAEVDLEYEILLTATTNLPLSYNITKNGETCDLENILEADADGTYYRKIKIGKVVDSEFVSKHEMKQEDDVTDEYCIQVTFPKENSTNLDYADLMEYINIDLSAKQVIGE